MKEINVGFIGADNLQDETQIDIEEGALEDEVVEIINLMLTLRDEMGIKEITYVEGLTRDLVTAFKWVNGIGDI